MFEIFDEMSHEKWYKNIFDYLYIFHIIFIIATFTGVLSIDPKYIDQLESILKYYVCFFLIVRFNPFVKPSTHLNNFDRRVAFSSGVFLLLSTAAKKIIDYYVSTISKSLNVPSGVLS